MVFQSELNVFSDLGLDFEENHLDASVFFRTGKDCEGIPICVSFDDELKKCEFVMSVYLEDWASLDESEVEEIMYRIQEEFENFGYDVGDKDGGLIMKSEGTSIVFIEGIVFFKTERFLEE